MTTRRRRGKRRRNAVCYMLFCVFPMILFLLALWLFQYNKGVFLEAVNPIIIVVHLYHHTCTWYTRYCTTIKLLSMIDNNNNFPHKYL